MKLIDSVPQVDADSPDGNKLEISEGQINIKNVHFRYPTRPGVRVLRNLSLKIEAGTYVALGMLTLLSL